MKEDESIKIAKAARALGVVLDMDTDPECAEVVLESNTRAHVDLAKRGLEELLHSPLEKANKRKALAEGHLQLAAELDFDDTELFGADGEPTEAAENGKRPETMRIHEPELDGIEPPAPFDKNAGIPVNIRAGLRQALNDCSGPKKACEDVAKLTGVEYAEVRDHFEQLERNGKIEKRAGTNGKTGKSTYHWVADPSDVNLEAGPDGVVATSETPDGEPAVTW